MLIIAVIMFGFAKMKLRKVFNNGSTLVGTHHSILWTWIFRSYIPSDTFNFNVLGIRVYISFLVGDELSIMFWLVLIVLTILIFVSDMAITQYYVKKLGGTKPGQIAPIIGTILGMFIYPPLGVIFVPIFLVFIVELIMFKKVQPAFYASLGSLLAFVTTTLFKVVVYTLIVVWFLLDVFVF